MGERSGWIFKKCFFDTIKNQPILCLGWVLVPCLGLGRMFNGEDMRIGFVTDGYIRNELAFWVILQLVMIPEFFPFLLIQGDSFFAF